MNYDAKSPDEYIAGLPQERRDTMEKLRRVILENLPAGFEEVMSYGMIGYVVPHSLYPKGYHVDPKLPLPFINLASQKNFIAIYHMGVYSDENLLEWFTKQYTQRCKTRLDMGKSCIRLKRTDDIPYELIGELAGKITVEGWTQAYEASTQGRRG